MLTNGILGLVETLKQHPQVVGLVEYGSARFADNFDAGDYDLFVIHDEIQTEVESLHFYVDTAFGHVPVDLNLRSLRYLASQNSLAGFESALLDGRIIYDSDGAVARRLVQLRAEAPSPYTEHDIAFTRHGHRHVLDKVRGRLQSEPLLCRLLLNVNIHWLINSYFGVRGLPYQGEKHALAYLADNEPEIYALIGEFYKLPVEEQIEQTERLTELVLSPVGGAWKTGELLAFGEGVADLQGQGQLLYKLLVG
ncbi:MAG: hypothetical protein H6645_03345 [Caldilineaceae bacterium]|nr:hypothetical protein [Caldilineaceae bacterium]